MDRVTAAVIIGAMVCATIVVGVFIVSAMVLYKSSPQPYPSDNRIKITYSFKGNNTVNIPIGEAFIGWWNSTGAGRIPAPLVSVLKQIEGRFETDETTVTVEVDNADQLVANILKSYKEYGR